MKKVIGETGKYFEKQDFLVSLLRKAVVIMSLPILFNSSSAQTVLFEEDFKDNQKGWEEANGVHESSLVKSGRYVIKTTDTNVWHWFSKPVRVKNETTWVIEADIFVDSAKTVESFLGIHWGAKDAENIFQALYYPNTGFATGKIIHNGQSDELFQYNSIELNTSSKIHFTLLKADNSFWYLLNGKAVDKVNASPLFGDEIGFIISGLTQISVDKIVVQSLDANSSLVADIKREFSKICDENGTVKRKWGHYQNLANKFLEKGDSVNARIAIDQCDSAVKAEFYSVDTIEYWRHRNPVASLLIDVGEFDKAKYILKHAIKAFENADSVNTSMYPVLLSNLGLSNSRSGQYGLAIKYYRMALDAREKMFGWKDERTVRTANYIIGVNVKSGETGNSGAVYKEILDGIKSERGEMCKEYFTAADDYANYLMSLGKSTLALDLLKHTLRSRQQLYIDTPYLLIQSLHYIGKTYLEIYALDSAEFYFFRANELAIKYHLNNWIPETEIALAEVYRLQGKNVKAKSILMKYYWIKRNRNDFQVNNNLGSILYGLGKYKKALKHFQISETVSNNWSTPYYLQSKKELIYLYNHLSKTYFILEKYHTAFDYSILTEKLIFLELNGNKNILSESDYFSFLNLFKDQTDWFQYLCALSTHEKNPEGNVRSDRDVFRFNELFHLPSKITPENAYFKGLLFKQDSLQIYLDTLNRKLITEDAAYLRLICFPLLNESGNGYLAIVKNGNSSHSDYIELDINSSFDSIFTFQKNLVVAKQTSDTKEYQLFWSKVAPYLAGKKKIYFAADGIFNNINIEALRLPGDGLHYLGDQYKIELVNSSREIFTATTNYNTLKSIALFGYPSYTLSKNEQRDIIRNSKIDTTELSFLRGSKGITAEYAFKPLPATKHEVEEIGADLNAKGWNVTIYIGVNALEEQVKKIQSPRVLHIATHGFFAQDLQEDGKVNFMGMDSRAVKENPMLRSGLAFAGAETTRTDTTRGQVSGIDDGILTAEEAQYLHLDSTELVVLSACETGLGEIVNGEGVYGLQRAFRAAGAKSVLMSLWKVDDLATETLMKNFYKHWLDDGLNKHDALWQAKLDLRNDKNHPQWALPYYWGAFVLIGE